MDYTSFFELITAKLKISSFIRRTPNSDPVLNKEKSVKRMYISMYQTM